MLNINLTKTCAAILAAGIILTSKNFTNPRIVPVEDPMKGLTVSEKVDNIDWDALSKNNDFILIHAGTGLEDDEKFDEYYEIAQDKGLDVGVFITNEISTYYRNSPSDVTKYAERRYSHVKISQLLGKNITYPIYLKIDYGETPIEDALPKEHANSLMNRFEMIMRHNKFIPGIYASEEIVNYFRENVEDFDERFEYILSESKEQISSSIEMLSADGIEEEYPDEKVETKKEEIPIKAKDLSDEIEIVYTMKNYNDQRRVVIPSILLTMEAAACLGIQKIIANQKKGKHAK